MKILYTLGFCLSMFVSFGQGTITGFSINPVNPTSTDTIYIYANLQFPYGACILDQQSHTINGNDVQADAHHCVGALTTICNNIDTFKINPLPAGNYTFHLNLTSGAAPAPCTPGIVPDHDSTFSFTVEPSGPAGLNKSSKSQFMIYPNPVVDHINVPLIPDQTPYDIINIAGQSVLSGLIKSQTIQNLGDLPRGLYFVKFKTPSGEVIRQFAKR